MVPAVWNVQLEITLFALVGMHGVPGIPHEVTRKVERFDEVYGVGYRDAVVEPRIIGCWREAFNGTHLCTLGHTVRIEVLRLDMVGFDYKSRTIPTSS